MGEINLFQEIAATYMSLCWFISMSASNLLHPIMPFAIILPVLLAFLPYRFIKDFYVRKSIALMPAFWVIIGLWGGVFRDQKNPSDWPNFVVYFVVFVLAVFLIYGIYCCFKNRGYRIPTIIFFAVNIYFALFVSLCAVMSITGDWL
jgi:hypothetical protein